MLSHNLVNPLMLGYDISDNLMLNHNIVNLLIWGYDISDNLMLFMILLTFY